MGVLISYKLLKEEQVRVVMSLALQNTNTLGIE